MKTINTLYRAAACLALCAATAAQAASDPPAPADPANADAAVPETRYRTSLPYRPLPKTTASADQNWAAANRTVGSLNSMSLTMGGAGPAAAPDAADHAGHAHGSAAQPAVQAPASSGHHHHHHEGNKQ